MKNIVNNNTNDSSLTINTIQQSEGVPTYPLPQIKEEQQLFNTNPMMPEDLSDDIKPNLISDESLVDSQPKRNILSEV